jgi:hypothetical protein
LNCDEESEEETEAMKGSAWLGAGEESEWRPEATEGGCRSVLAGSGESECRENLRCSAGVVSGTITGELFGFVLLPFVFVLLPFLLVLVGFGIVFLVKGDV